MPASLQVEVVGHGGLMALVEDIRARPWRYPVVPISAMRAATHAANPVARPDDPALLLVLADGLCRGYLGLMPQEIATGTGVSRVLAFTTLLVDTPLRGRGAADLLLDTARSLGPLLTLGNSNAAQGFFRKRGLRALPAYRVVYLPLGPGHGLARLRDGLRKRLRRRGLGGLAGATDALLGLLSRLSSPLSTQARRRLADACGDAGDRSVEPCDRVPDAASAVLSPRTGRSVWRPASLNWLLDGNARLADPALQMAMPGRYHFQSDDSPRRYHACLLRERGQLRGVAAYQFHHIHGQATLSILHASVPGDDWLRLVVRHGLALAQHHGADTLRAGSEFAAVFARLAPGARLPVRERAGYVDDGANPHAFDGYQESFADGDIALY